MFMFFCPKLRSGPSVLTVLGTVIVFNSLSFGVPGSFSPQEDRDVTFYIVKLPEACAGLFFFFSFFKYRELWGNETATSVRTLQSAVELGLVYVTESCQCV